MRSISAKIGILPQVDGSAMFEMGNTRVIASLYGPREVGGGVRPPFAHLEKLHSRGSEVWP